MRILIFLLALTSAFFVSAQPVIDDESSPYHGYEYVSANEQEGILYVDSSYGTTWPSPKAGFDNYFNYESFAADFFLVNTLTERVDVSGRFHTYYIKFETFSDCSGSPCNRHEKAFTRQFTTTDGTVYSCPESHNIGPVEITGSQLCLREPTPPEPDSDCPAPTDNDPFVFGSGGGQTSVCFPAQNGRQCEIQTDENGGYYIPASYGSAEPVSCIPDIDPSPDPEPTPEPEPKPDPDPTDPEPEANELDAINKVNENLDVLNQNQSASSESNDERLDRIALEIQNSNELLSAIKGKPVSGGGSNINNGALTEIAENTKPKEFNFNANRKQGGLNDIFTGDDLAQVEQEIEDKKTELADYIEKIKSESKAIFDINTNISGSYTEHKETIKGAEVDLGVGRFSGFFQIIAPALIFVATVAALFIMLGGNKE